MADTNVYLQPPWVMHSCHRRLVDYPPEGYKFVLRETPQEKLFRSAIRSSTLRLLLAQSDVFWPTTLVKAFLERNNKPPAGSVLTYASEHLVLRPEPWVVEMEFAHLLIGRHPKHLRRYKGIFERALASSHCRRIICWSEAARRTLADLDTSGFADKVEVIYYSVPSRPFEKQFQDEKVRIFSIAAGTPARAHEEFEYKGGREVLEAFVQLRKKYSNVELVLRSKVPPEIKERYAGLEGLRIIDSFISWEDLEREYTAADIFFTPSHTTTFMTLLEAMSFELPVVTIDSWSNAEHVEDGKTGLVASRSKRLPYFYPNTVQTNFGTPEFEEAMVHTDPDVVHELVQKLSILIEDPDLRRKMGRAARKEIDEGKFSIATMNGKLRRVFDEALARDG